MKRTARFRGCAAARRRKALYRPYLEFLEARLPPGDILLGALLGSWLVAPADSRALNDSADSLLDKQPDGSLLPESNQNLAAVHFSFPDDPLRTVRLEDMPTKANDVTVPDVTGRPRTDWTTLEAIAVSPARFLSPNLGVNGAFYQGQGTAQLSGMAGALGAPSQPGTPVIIPAIATHSPARSALSAFSAVNRPPVHSSSTNPSVIRQNYGQTPLSFEANIGQADSSVQFLAHGPGYSLYLTGSEAVMVLNNVGQVSNLPGADEPNWKTATPDVASSQLAPQSESPPAMVRMQVLGGNPAPQVVGLDQLPGQVNYFLGNDPGNWHTHISTFARIEYQNVYPSINLDYYSHQGQLEYDFVVAPGADPRVIHLGFTGADQLSLNDNGDLLIHAGTQDIVQHRPVVYQEVNDSRQEIASAILLQHKASGDALAPREPAPRSQPDSSADIQEVGFTLGNYDAIRPLVIDPVLAYSTYLGGNAYDSGSAIAVDPATGDALVTGATGSADFPTANPFQPNYGGGEDAFVARLSADGSTLVYSTYLGGSNFDYGKGIAVDPGTGDVLVIGTTASTNFPTANALQPTYGGGGSDAFVTRLSADGSALIYSTYLGGSRDDGGYGIALDPATDDALITGWTKSTNFPTANPFQPNYGGGGHNAFVARLSADGRTLVYSTYLGGSDDDWGYAIAVDPGTGDALVTGLTFSTDFPTANAFQPTNHGSNAFVTRLSADGSTLVYSTYLGGSTYDEADGVAVDPVTGDVLVTGYTGSTDFPTANPFQPTLRGTQNAFVTRLSADGSTLVYSTYLGGSSLDEGYAIAVDPATGDAVVTGGTASTDFPTANPIQPTIHTAFVTLLSADGSALIYSTYLGGSGSDQGRGIAVDPATGDALVTGYTTSTDFPTVNAFQPRNHGGYDAFVVRIGG
jgi:hypothetical protein